ncbi:MAG: 50S ribosomal protein L30 [Holosporales bacterium]|jgi:large subunit ribosomal protein L30|nr:50S ribosomal protein L30 [Holosporales bacterium]
MVAKKKVSSLAFLCITQVKSAIRRQERQGLCLKALGLGRIGKTVRRQDTPSCRGLVRSVQHLVKLEKVE